MWIAVAGNAVSMYASLPAPSAKFASLLSRDRAAARDDASGPAGGEQVPPFRVFGAPEESAPSRLHGDKRRARQARTRGSALRPPEAKPTM